LGFDGKFEFEEIGLNYVEHGVPYVGLRVIPALFGAALVPLVYLIMQESGYAVITCILTSSLVLLDNSLVTQSRLILLDSQLIFFATLSIFCYIKFYKLRTK
jgi:dolichyl-phosphate-mannose-protein mannosyltransferase